ncbi:cobalamin biosynthesis protein [Caminicella sporogenes]|uniref:GHMP family kinase ATP-binding protein n=1 Tax=Caminicella sporogenes TaxID=166485 RepID=UPI0025407C7B|nr:cobalamin biosynthesis protein [Caminicella sporogenes]WIF94962.1 cobalamin biosynthesis protein [Caminicella sporogenes]
MKVKVKCPGSCGEYIQGIIGDSEKLISLPVDIYSEVTIEEKKNFHLDKKRKKAISALYKTLEYFDVPIEYVKSLSLTINSKIPIAKGMASSTADIYGTIMATAKLIDKKLSEEEIAKLCSSIEPTDSIIFEKLTLFDHIKGVIKKRFEWNPKINILVLEGKGTLDTQEFRKRDFDHLRKKNKKYVEKAFEYFSRACREKDKKLLGMACTISSLANQDIVFKPKLNEIIEISYKFNAYGVNVAHSGTVIGILYDENAADIEKLIYSLNKINISEEYSKIYSVKSVEGGVRYLVK